MGENISTILQHKLPPKCKDPGMFTIPCKIGNTRFECAMCDLGASINVMPKSIFDTIHIGELKTTRVIIQLAPDGVIEDVLVQVDGLLFPADFYVLDMGNRSSTNSVPILLGRPFLKIARTKIDVHEGALTMEFDGQVIKFSILDAMKYPDNCHPLYVVDVVDPIVQDIFDFSFTDGLKIALEKHLELTDVNNPWRSIPILRHVKEEIQDLHNLDLIDAPPFLAFMELPISSNKLLSSIVQAPSVELKPLPYHLKYTFLGDNETLPVIISKLLTPL